MAGTLASPTFVTGARDEMAAADVYTQSSSAPINSIAANPASVANTEKVKLAQQLAGGKSMLANIKAGLNAAKTIKALTAKGGDTLSRITQAQSGVGALVKALPTSMSSMSSKLLAGVQGLSSISMTVNGMQRRLKYGSDLSKISAIGDMINAASCDKKVFAINDRGAAVGAYSGVINTAMHSGIPGAYGAVLKCESDPIVLNRVTASCLPGVIQTGDIQSLAAMADKVQPGVIQNLNPNVLSDFSGHYPTPDEISAQAMNNVYGTVKDTYTKVDPNWNTTTRNGENIINLTAVQGASDDFNNMMTAGVMSNPDAPVEEQLMLTAQKFPPVSVTDQLKKQYPMTTVMDQKPAYENTSSPTVQTVDTMMADTSNSSYVPIAPHEGDVSLLPKIDYTSKTVTVDENGNTHERSTKVNPDGTVLWHEVVFDKTGKLLESSSGPD